MEKRDQLLAEIDRSLAIQPILALLGPRQCGKTTLAKMYCKKLESFPAINYFDLESPVDLERLANPILTLSALSGLIVIDEIQRIPELFPVLRVLVDQEGNNRRFLILGSASRELIRQSSESLAGRIAYRELTPFSYQEVDHLERLWLRGGFPRSYLAKTEEASFDWRNSYIQTFLEQDIPNLVPRLKSF
jgi:hypothetical protein